MKEKRKDYGEEKRNIVGNSLMTSRGYFNRVRLCLPLHHRYIPGVLLMIIANDKFFFHKFIDIYNFSLDMVFFLFYLKNFCTYSYFYNFCFVESCYFVESYYFSCIYYYYIKLLVYLSCNYKIIIFYNYSYNLYFKQKR